MGPVKPPSPPPSETLYFSVDSMLLRELGDRLVGQAHIALAELIKNSYDADATLVDVVFGEDGIVVRDNGHGMTHDEFRDLWMRIGSPHKEREQHSRKLQRPLTGSKGVGRLAAQFLGREIELRTVSAEAPTEETVAEIDWDEAVEAGELTQAEAHVAVRQPVTSLPGASPHGTWIRVDRLKQDWGADELDEVARALWPLQPPFGRALTDDEDDENDESTPNGSAPGGDLLQEFLEELDLEDEQSPVDQSSAGFRIRLRTRDRYATRRFEQQMRRVLDLWSARITGTLEVPKRRGLVDGRLIVDVEFADGEHRRYEEEVKRQRLHRLRFEVRVYSLHHRQRFQIKVEEARDYLRDNGGVHIYDAGFHLPYYGANTDWLWLERDHANRLSRSELLPKDLNVARGLNALPTNRRVYGVVDIDTARERRMAQDGKRTRDALTIQVTRDRVADNRGFRDLRRFVRTALDFYAVQETQRSQARAATVGHEPTPAKARRVREVLERHRDEMSKSTYRDLDKEITGVLESVRTEAEKQAAQAGMLGSLATAGITAIAFEHEFNRQLSALDALARMLASAKTMADARKLAERVQQTVASARASRRLFSHLLDEGDRQERHALRARVVLDSTRDQLQHFMRGVQVDHDGVPDDFRLPPGTLAEWNSLFQNVYINAINAMLDGDVRRIAAVAEADQRTRRLVVQDTGTGVDLEFAESLFEPFERRQQLSEDRRRLGLGGAGLGLTIVRMLATNLGCTVRFVRPSPDFNTALELAWEARSRST
jgi:signal transduction histidine kinase